jgi:Cu(I)/Ag(I) efflux system membrane fusion protein
VAKKMVNPGDYIERGQAIFEITDLSKIWVLFDVYESDVSWVKKCDHVEFTIESLPGEHFKGLITYLDPVIDPGTRVARARVEMRNSGFKLKPEMFASGTVESRLQNKGKTITIPKTAVMWTGKRSVVYVKNASAKGVSFRMRVVTLGPSLGESYVIESGLAPDEEIAVNGTFSIDAAAQLAGKPSMMNPEGGPEMTGHNHGGAEIPAPSKKTATVAEPAGKLEVPIDQKAKVALQPLYTDYLNLKDALVADNLTDAQKAAVKMLQSLSNVDMTVFNDRAHDTWMKLSAELESALEHAPHFKTIEELRKAFQPVSKTMIALSKSLNPMNKTMYVQHCPMADNNKGADWLSLDKNIKNPYFGASMLTCGEVTETVKNK